MLDMPAFAALLMLPLVLPIALWVGWSDMKFMKIPNKAVLALVAVFAVMGLLTLPLIDYAWRWTHLAVVLAVGFGLSVAGLMGAGDAKFGAAMAPFVALGDVLPFISLFAASLIVAFILHRIARAIPAVRARAPDWLSWDHPKFPMGIALSAGLVLYLGAAVFYGA